MSSDRHGHGSNITKSLGLYTVSVSDHCQPEPAVAVEFLPKRVCGALGMPPCCIVYYILKELSVYLF